MTFQQTLLSAALLAALFATAPVAAQDTTTDTEVVADASVPKDRLVERYAELAGDEASAEALVTNLREGGEFTVTTTETRTVVDADGNPVLDANGNEQTETVTVTDTIENPNGPMGWGEVNITLAMAERLLESGEFDDLQTALTGSSVTDADGNTVTVDGLLQLRADGMGWGRIAQEYDFKLGAIMGKAPMRDGATSSGGDRAAKAERASKPERVAKVDRPARPERAERPERPQKPERPEKPERAGRP
jgi:hypothetical protein